MLVVLPPLAAETIFHIGSFPVTNAYINSTIAVVIFFFLGLWLRKKTALVPGKAQNVAETVLETLLSYMDRVTNDRQKSVRFLPIVAGIFLFILFSNWLGLLPGTGSIGRYLVHEGHIELVPLLRPANADLNMTLAMSVFAVIFANLVGIITIGFFRYANKFVKLGDVVNSFRKKKIDIMVALIEFAAGFLEIVSEIAKVISLSLRLFGNIFAGEVLLTVLAGLFAYFLPLPFMFLELLVGLIQALVFAMLTLVYLSVATMPLHGKAESGHH